jgi:hypothetical protein
MAKVEQDLVNKQIKEKQSEIEAKLQEALAAQSEELIKLIEANPNAEIYVNITFELNRYNMAVRGPQGPEIVQSLPVVEVARVGYSVKPWGPTPTRIDTVACVQTIEVESLTVSDKLPIKELFEE